MTIKELAERLGGELAVDSGADKELSAFYAGDFLSNVMAKAPASGAWFTVMNNVNVAGVAVLADVAVIVICEGVKPHLSLEAKAEEQGLCIICTELPVFEACVRAGK